MGKGPMEMGARLTTRRGEGSLSQQQQEISQQMLERRGG